MNQASNDIYAIYKGSLPSMEVFSICAWVKFHFEVNNDLPKGPGEGAQSTELELGAGARSWS